MNLNDTVFAVIDNINIVFRF